MTEDIDNEDGAPAGASGAPAEDEIRMRAWEISRRDDAGSAEDNWQRAIDELHAERAQPPRS